MLPRRTLSAIAVVLDLARLARGRPLSAKLLAGKHDLPPRQFETVLQDLVRAGILKGLRGPRGGYELARERRRISLGDIVRAMEPRPGEGAGEPPAIAAVAALIAPVTEAAAAAFLARLDAVSIDQFGRSDEDRRVPSHAADYTI